VILEILDLQLDLLTTATEAALSDDRDVALALDRDREGIGAAAGSLDRKPAPSSPGQVSPQGAAGRT